MYTGKICQVKIYSFFSMMLTTFVYERGFMGKSLEKVKRKRGIKCLISRGCTRRTEARNIRLLLAVEELQQEAPDRKKKEAQASFFFISLS